MAKSKNTKLSVSPEQAAAVQAFLAGLSEPAKTRSTGTARAATTNPSLAKGEVLVAKAGLTPVRGRVYVTGAVIEAQARVLKTGKPEVVRNTGTHRTKGVLVYRHDKDTAALQNLGEPR